MMRYKPLNYVFTSTPDLGDLPDEMLAVRHRSHSADRAADTGKLECSPRLPQTLM